MLNLPPTSRAMWGWEVNTDRLGGPQSRLRTVHVSAMGTITKPYRAATVRILDVFIPICIDDSLSSHHGESVVLDCDFNIMYNSGTAFPSDPTPLGYLHVRRDSFATGMEDKAPKGEGVVTSLPSTSGI